MVSRQLFAMLGQSRTFAQVLDEARLVSATDLNVLLAGESGTDKGLLAQFIHENSPRRQGKMLSQNCTGVAPSRLNTDLFECGLFERAHRGTLLLLDVDEMGARTQQRMLRFLENDETPDVRIISATTRDLLERPSERAFCVDLYYRLNVAHLRIPALRECRDDISFLVRNFLKLLSEHFRLPLCELGPSAMAALEAYGWPGNISELRAVAQQLALSHAGRVVAADELPEAVLAQTGPVPPTDPKRSFTFLQRPRALRAAIDDAGRVTPAGQRKAVRVRRTTGPSIPSSRPASARARA